MRFIRLGLYGILLTPLLVSTRFTLPFLTPKVVAFQILMDLVMGAACLVELRRIFRGQTSPTQPSLLPSSTLSVALAIFFGYSVVTAALGADLQRSLWGFEERQDGLVLLFHFYCWFLVLAWMARSEGVWNPLKSNSRIQKPTRPSDLWQWDRYLDFSYWVSSLVALSAIVQWLDAEYEFFGFISPSVIAAIKYQFSSTRSGGVMGNPEYLGPYLLFHVFYGVYLIRSRLRNLLRTANTQKRESRTRQKRGGFQFALIIFAEIVLVAAVFVGETRGVIVGLGFGLLLLAATYAFRDSSRKTRIAGICVCLALIIGSGIVWRSRNSSIVQRVPGLGRLVRGLSLQEDSTWVRLRYWKSAITGLRDHAVLGWGHNNAFYPLNKYYNPELIRFDQAGRNLPDRGFRQTWSDKSHNAYLDLLVEKGVVGGFLFLAIVTVVLRALWRLPRREAASYLAAGFAAYMISNLVAFDTFGSYFGLFLFLSWCDVEGHRDQSPAKLVQQIKVRGSKSEREFRKKGAVAASLILAGACAVFVYLNVEMGMASAECSEAHDIFPSYPGDGLALYKAAFQRFFPYSDKEKLECAALIIRMVVENQKNPAVNAKIDQALQLGEEAVNAHPRDAYLCLWLGQLYTNLGVYVDKKYLNGGGIFGGRALELSPKRQEVIMHLARTYSLAGQPYRAVALNRRMVEAYPGYGLGHWYYGLSLLEVNQREEAKKEIRKALETGFRPQEGDESKIVRQLLAP